MSSTQEKAHEARDLDLGTAARGVWLVKVPKYLNEKWKKAEGNRDVGRLRISKPKFPGGKPEVIFHLNSELAQKDPNDVNDSTAPTAHRFVLTGIGGQSLSVLSQTPSNPNAIQGASADEPLDRLAIEGKVIQRAECRPVLDKNYMAVKKLKMEQVTRPDRQVIRLDKAQVNYKPIAYQPQHLAENLKKKEETKRARDDKDKVMDMLFNAFEKHQYYNVKDLQRITDQPITYLKEILKEICTYNVKAPHKNMWELKAEYRHYKEQT